MLEEHYEMERHIDQAKHTDVLLGTISTTDASETVTGVLVYTGSTLCSINQLHQFFIF